MFSTLISCSEISETRDGFSSSLLLDFVQCVLYNGNTMLYKPAVLFSSGDRSL